MQDDLDGDGQQPVQDQENQQVHEKPQEVRRSDTPRKTNSLISPAIWSLVSDGEELESYDESIVDVHQKEWKIVMQEEIKSLHENHTYDLVGLPKGRKAL